MPTIYMISLGCAKNRVDTETMLGETLDDEFSLVVDPSFADVIIVNTCGFIEEAREEAAAVIEDCLDIKAQSKRKIRVVAAGCWAQREPEVLLGEFPGLDAVWGLDIASSLKDAIRSLGADPAISGIGNEGPVREGVRLITTPPSFAYLRLSDGCDNRCHYCAIPLIRGGFRSRTPDAVVEEAKILADQGTKEIVLISQDTTAFAKDLGLPGVNLASLLERLLSELSVPRLRVLYAHPAHLDDRVIELIRTEPRLCGYLDLPIQHISDAVLQRMGRGYGKDRVYEIADKLGPDVTLRTTLLLGYPGETEDEFAEALALVETGRFRHIGAFAYSPEPGTKAVALPDQIPADVAQLRRDEIMEAQADVAFDWLQSRLGQTEAVLIDDREDEDFAIGRSRHEAPDADGVIYIQDSKHQPGDIVMTCITGRDGYDLMGTSKMKDKKKKNRNKR